jgi:hypothetical protein
MRDAGVARALAEARAKSPAPLTADETAQIVRDAVAGAAIDFDVTVHDNTGA